MSGRGNFRGRGGPGGGNRGGGGGNQGNRGDRQGGGGGGYRGPGDHRGGRGGSGQDSRPPQRQEIYSPPGGLTPPSAEVQRAEDEMVAKKDNLSLSGLSLGAQPVMPLRPAYGTQGTAVVLRSNHFQIVVPDPKFQLYQYHVDVHPEPNAARKWKRIFQIFIKEADFLAEARPAVATNNRSMIITTKKLPLENDRASSLILYYEEADLQAPVPDPSRPAQRIDRYQVKISLTNTLAIDQLIESLKPAGADQPIEKEPFAQALNIAVQRKPGDTRGIATIPKSTKFFPLGAEGFLGNLGGGLVALGGYYTSVRTSTLRLLLNVNSVTSAFYQEGPLLDLMRTYRDSYKGPLDSTRALTKFLKGVRVRVSHLKSADGSEKVKTIFGLATEPRGAPANKIKFFWDKEGKMVTVHDYFRKQYNITLQQVNVPVVNVGNDQFPNYMPVELCHVLPGQVAKKKLSGEQTDAMVNCACRTPARNANLITSQGSRALGLEQHVTDGPTLFGMRINPQMITVPGRILKSPMVYYGTIGKSTAAGTWNSIGAKFSVPRRADRWGYFRIRMPGNDHKSQEELKDIVGGEFYNALKNSGLNPDRPIRPEGFPDLTLTGRQADHLGQIDKYFASQVMTTQARMLLIIIPSKSQALYANIKYLGDIKYGIHTVCALAKNMDKARGRSGYLVNIALKWNLKKGGTNQQINQSDVGVPLSKTMFMGIDVTHPGAGAQKQAPSIAGVVANINSQLGQWPASIRIQKSRQEMVSDLDEMIVERLKVWVKHNKVLPENIIVYRDGVSEGQYATVLREEWPAFEKAMTIMYPKGPKPKISMIVVGKRHHTRFYPTREEDSIKNNPKNGTVVDRGVTSERYWDFFLQAHTALQGTCRPAHYVVLKDQNKLGAHGLENLTHNLCYTFGRCNRSVSICPPAYYADLVCDRARFYLFDTFAGSDNNDNASESAESGFQASNARWRSGVHPNLAETMFYI